MKYKLRFVSLSIFLMPLQLFSQGRCFILPESLPEVSGLFIASPDSLWWQNDGDNPASLFLTDGQGRLLATVPVPGTQNRDWEDLSAGPDGKIFIGDFGNNLNKRKDLRVYIFSPKSQKLDSILFNYPDQEAFPPPAQYADFDVEAFFYLADSLHLFTKSPFKKGRFITKHYVLPAQPGQYTALLRDSLFLKNRLVTGAAINSEGTKVALLSYRIYWLAGIFPSTRTTVFWLDNYPAGHWLRGRLHRKNVRTFFLPTLYEAIDFMNANEVLIASEKMPFFKAKARRVKL